MSCFLNIDLGEADDEPDALYALAHVANIACTGHAGDDASMTHALARCMRHGTRIGAHPSYPDRAGFGRRRQALGSAALRATVAAQCARLAVLAGRRGVRVAYVKPHGALYHAADADAALAHAVIDGASAALGPDVCVIGPPGGELQRAAHAAGLAYAREGFADRRRDAQGALLPRGTPGALLTDPAAAQACAHALLQGAAPDTLCVHSDTPGAEAIARAVRAVLDKARYAPAAGVRKPAVPE